MSNHFDVLNGALNGALEPTVIFPSENKLLRL